MPSKKRRGQTIVRNDTGQRIDPKSKQLLFFQCDVETVKRLPLKSYEDFTQEGAKQVFDKYQRKRQSRSILYCLIDRMRFEKRGAIGSNPFRKHLTYREIRHFFVFPENPRIFMLCVADEWGKRSYELYRCKPEDVTTICDLTYGASTDPQNIIRDIASPMHHSISSNDVGLSPSITGDQSLDGKAYMNGPEAKVLSEHRVTKVSKSVSVDAVLSDRSLYESSIKSADVFWNAQSASQNAKPAKVSVTNGIVKKSNVTGVYSYYEFKDAGNLPQSKPDRSNEVRNFQVNHRNPIPIKLIRPVNSELSLNQQNFQHSPVSNCPSVPKTFSPTLTNFVHHEKEIARNRKPDDIIIVREYPQITQSACKTFHSTLDLRSGDEITFIGRDSQRGTQVTDHGPVYMYITRYESQQDVRLPKPEQQLNRFPRLTVFSESSESFLSDEI